METYPSVFSFCLCRQGSDADFTADAVCNIGGYTFRADCRTPLDCAQYGGRELIIFGYATDVFTAQRNNIAETILASTTDADGVFDYEKKLGGKYVIFYCENGDLYCLGDATCSVPIFYTVGTDDFICCSNPQFIVRTLGLSPDPKLQKVRNSGPLNQAMPYDVTPYKEMKQLIPNCVFDVSAGKTRRLVNSRAKQKTVSPAEAAKITAPMITNITKMYASDYEIYCPLTSGRDSRVVFAFLKSLGIPLNSYTIWKDSFKKDPQDWEIPVSLSKICDSNHEQIHKETVSEEKKAQMDLLLGENSYPQEAFTLAVTVERHYHGFATLEGDIIGQVGKCSLHRDIPLALATPAYFRCKLHNYSRESRQILREWLSDIGASGEKVNVFDLFSIENRLGVWASHTHLIRNVMGMSFFNIFNSRSIIYVWTAVSRKERMKSAIHVELIRLIAPELLDVPFEQDKSGLVQLAKSSWPVFYFATFAKYLVQRTAFFKNKQKSSGE
ncbi:MAG: hypothetical protein IKB88_10360 [Clostridia bacterium]|nr:hypothetical protein [Clostridia bacterium]